jgi:hypothetical protein
MKFVKLSQNLQKYALNVRSVTLGYAHILGYIDVAKFLMYSVPGFQLLKIDPF